MAFCYRCGFKLIVGVPVGDDRERAYCAQCGYIHYSNPAVQVAIVACHNDKILWLKRAIEPRVGFWALPGGFLENSESLRECAARELLEETGARIELDDLVFYGAGTIPEPSQVHILFRGPLKTMVVEPGPESLEVAWFSAAEFPWQDIAFPELTESIRIAYRELESGQYETYYVELGANKQMKIF